MKKFLVIFLIIVIVLGALGAGAYFLFFNKATVTFESNGGSAVESVKVNKGSTIEEPTAPTKTGFTFVGWYKEKSLQNSWNFASDKVEENTTLYAKWKADETSGVEENTYTVTFESNGGSEVDSKIVNSGELVLEPDEPIKEGFIFAGWYKESTFENEWNFAVDTITENTTLYAKWVSDDTTIYLVNFNTNGGNIIPPKKVIEGEKVGNIVSPTQIGYTFDGWYKESTFDTKWDLANDIVTENITLYAKWNILSFTVIFESNGGSVVASKNANYDTLIGEPTIPTKAGYTFKGWYKDSGLQTKWNFTSDKVKENITLYAKWEEVVEVTKCNVTFNANGGKWGNNTIQTFEVDKNSTIQNIIPSNPVRDLYVFAGWYKETSLTNEWDFVSDKVTVNTTLYAKWVANEEAIKVNFNFMGYGSNYNILVAPNGLVPYQYIYEPSGKKFEGWYTEDNFQNKWNFDNDRVTSDITLYARWVTDYVTVTFDANGGTFNSNPTHSVQLVRSVDSLGRPTPPTREGYNFITWCSDKDCQREYTYFGKAVLGDMTLYAKWTLENDAFTLTEFTNNGNLAYKIKAKAGVNYGEELTIPAYIDGIPVLEIEASGFYNIDSIKKITIEDGITTIGGYAFGDCDSLEVVYVGKSVASVASNSFPNTNFYTTIYYEGNARGSGRVYGSVKETDYAIINGIQYIVRDKVVYVSGTTKALEGKNIVIPASVNINGVNYTVEQLGEYAFANTAHVYGFIELPSTIKRVNSYALSATFRGIFLPDTIEYVGYMTTTTPVYIESASLKANWDIKNIDTAPVYFGVTRADVVTNSSYDYCKQGNGAVLSYAEKEVVVVNDIKSSITINGTADCFVIKIGNYSFSSNKLQKITIPNTVEEIGFSAFLNSNLLEEVVLTNSVMIIGQDAFSNCNKLSTIDLSNVTSIGSGAFNKCYALTEVTLSDDLKEINSNTFNSCTALTNINLPKNLETIGSQAFYICNELIGKDITYNGEQVKGLVIPASVTSIGANTFYQCNKLNLYFYQMEVPSFSTNWNRTNGGTGKIPTFVGYGNFTSTDGDFTYYLNDNKAVLTDYTGTKTDVVVPETINGYEVIELNNVFKGNTTMTSLTIPFVGTKNMSSEDSFNISVWFGGSVPSTLKTITLTKGTNIPISTFNSLPSVETINLPNTLKHIGKYAFANNSNLISINLPKSVEEIDEGAFSYTSATINFDANSTITRIGDGVFQNYLGTEINLPQSVTVIGDYAFRNCTKLNSCCITKNVTSIGVEAFAYITAPIVFEAGSSYKEITEGSFRYYYGTEIAIPASVEKMCENTFAGCWNLESVTFENGSNLKELPTGTFAGCSNINNIALSEGLVVVGERAFNGCGKLTEIVLPSTVTTIKNLAFSNLQYLESINLENVKEMGESVLAGCSKITNIDLSSIEKMGNGALNGIENLSYLRLPKTLTSVGEGALPINGVVYYFESASLPACSTAGGNIFAGDGAAYYLGINSNNFYQDKDFHYVLDLTNKTAIISKYIGNDTNVVLPNNVVVKGVTYTINGLGGSAFAKNMVVESVSGLENMKNLGAFIFYNCTSLKDVILPSSITKVPVAMFYNCVYLKDIEIPNSVVEIGDSSFASCGINSIELPNGLTKIGASAFYNCNSLASIYIPSTVAEIGQYGLYTNNLTCFFEADSFDANGIQIFGYNPKIYFGINSNKYFEADNGLLYELDETNKTASVIKYIGENDNVVVPSSISVNGNTYQVLKISSLAFANVCGLSSIIIEEGVSVLENNIIANCYDLRYMIIPSTITSTNSGALPTYNFNNQTPQFTKYYFAANALPSGINSSAASTYYAVGLDKSLLYEIGDFQYVLNLSNNTAILTCYTGNSSSVNVPTSIQVNGVTYNVEVIGAGAFTGNKTLTNVTLNEGLKEIRYMSFVGCKCLNSMFIPDSVTTINNALPNGDRAYYLLGGTIPSGISVNDNTTNYLIGDKTNFFEENGFEYVLDKTNKTAKVAWYNGNAKSVVIPKTITVNGEVYNVIYIGAYAFNKAIVEEIVINANLTSIFYNAFPISVKKIYFAENVSQDTTNFNGSWNYNNAKVFFSGEWQMVGNVPTPLV